MSVMQSLTSNEVVVKPAELSQSYQSSPEPASRQRLLPQAVQQNEAFNFFERQQSDRKKRTF